MGRSHGSVVKSFADGKTSGKGSRIFINDSRIYSYGYHFTLAVRPKGRKEFGAGIEHVINADRYSPSTTGHTNLCIKALENNVQIPFSAIAAAGYETRWGRRIEELQIIDNRPDKTW